MVTQAKIELTHHQRLQHLEQSQLVGYWAKTKGIRADDLVRHPQIDDVILLMVFQKEFHRDITKSNLKYLDDLWQKTYVQKRGLGWGNLNKLHHIAINGINTRHFKALVKTEQRQKIQQLRKNMTVSRRRKKSTRQNNKPVHDMTAKGTGRDQTPPWE
jgi:hypothetical protein